jgi:hypothetical protein
VIRTVAHPKFGFVETQEGLYPILQDPACVLNQVLQHTQPLSQLSAKQVLREAYDVTFGIFDHLQQAQFEKSRPGPQSKRPLASVAMHPAEEWARENSDLDRVMRGFADNDVGGIFKISFPEFLALPVEYAERMMRISKSILARKAQHSSSQEAKLEHELERGK